MKMYEKKEWIDVLAWPQSTYSKLCAIIYYSFENNQVIFWWQKFITKYFQKLAFWTTTWNDRCFRHCGLWKHIPEISFTSNHLQNTSCSVGFLSSFTVSTTKQQHIPQKFQCLSYSSINCCVVKLGWMTVRNEKMIMKRKAVYSHWGWSIGIILHFVLNPIWLLPDAGNISSILLPILQYWLFSKSCLYMYGSKPQERVSEF